ncbi:MAG: SO2930 family diheme c-type cytochrome [Pseudomonadota bacterium]
MTALKGRLAILLAVALAACGGPAEEAPTGPRLDLILADRAAPNLSDYGLFKDAAATEPAEGVAAYDLINPLFTDHALKHRFVYVPEGEAAAYSGSDVFEFPVGTVLAKTFAFAPDLRAPEAGQYKVETRLLIRKADGWAAYPYVWNAEGTEAAYAPAGGAQSIDVIDPAGDTLTIDYAIPNRNQCKTCHQAGEDLVPIGPKARHLNHAGPYGVNQIADWTARGLLDGAPDIVPADAPVGDQSLPLEARTRAYLEINCAHCHKADGSASNTGLWLDAAETRPVRLGVLKHPTAAGRGSGDGIYVIAPGDADASIFVYRMASAEAGIAMPELGRSIIDEDGLELVRAWIDGMAHNVENEVNTPQALRAGRD